MLYSGIYGYLDNIDLSEVNHYEETLTRFLMNENMQIFQEYLFNLPSENTFQLENNFIDGIVRFFDLVYPVYDAFEELFVVDENENISDLNQDLLDVFNE